MSRTDEEVVSDIQKKVSELNKLLSEAGNQNISVDISANKAMDMATMEYVFVNFKAYKRLTPNYIPSTGGY